MSGFNDFIYKIKRSQNPFFRGLKRFLGYVMYPTAYRMPRWTKPPLRLAYELHWMGVAIFRLLVNLFYGYPLFQARCATFGKDIRIDKMPFVTGGVEIHMHDNSGIGGNVSILSGSVYKNPVLIFRERAGVGWGTTITVNREVILEEDVIVSYDCRISDTDGHRREADLRAAGQPPSPEDCRPVRIKKNAWIGNGTHIMKGVTIGEGAIIGANSVVISDIPPYALAMGNPAEVILPNVGLPSTRRRRKPPLQRPPEGESNT